MQFLFCFCYPRFSNISCVHHLYLHPELFPTVSDCLVGEKKMISCPRFYSFLFLQFPSLLPVYEFQNLIRRRSPEDQHEAIKYVPTASYKIQQFETQRKLGNACVYAFIVSIFSIPEFIPCSSGRPRSY